MRLHLEAYPSLYKHAIGLIADPMAIVRCAPFPDSNANTWGTTDAAANAAAMVEHLRRRSLELRAVHWVWADRLITDPLLAAVYPAGDPEGKLGPTAEELAQDIFRNRLSSANLVRVLLPRLRLIRARGLQDTPLVYIDAEYIPCSENGAQFPGVWDLLRVLCSGEDDVQIQRRVRLAVYTALGNAAAVLGLNRDTLACWGCADRPQGWGANPINRPALGVPTPRPHLIFTTGAPEETERMDMELRGGSGPANAVVHLSTGVAPETNAARLAKCLAAGVPDVILYAEEQVPGVDNPTFQQRHDAAVSRLDAHLPVFRSFKESA